MTPAEVAATLRQFNGWRRGGDIEQPGPLAVGEAIDAAVEMIDRLEALPARITPEQAPAGARDYCHEAAEGYADGWNACMRAIKEETNDRHRRPEAGQAPSEFNYRACADRPPRSG